MGGIRSTLDIVLENYIDRNRNYLILILIDKAIGEYLGATYAIYVKKIISNID